MSLARLGALASTRAPAPHSSSSSEDGGPPAIIVEDMRCETPLLAVGFEEDLPWTPQTEGWMAGGAFGLLFAAILWGLFVGLCEVLVTRGPTLGRVFGAMLFYPFTTLEEGVFTMVQGLRQALIGTAIIGAAALVYRVIRSGRPARR